jgi:glycosyltransferase involved in cell wall biosynthesis
VRNAHLLLSLEAADAAVSPTEWQRSRHPRVLQPKIRTIFDGIDTNAIRPDPAASFTLDDGRTLTAADEVLTYVARNLEPYRGFPSFMRALPAILEARPQAQVIVVGGDEVSYGRTPEGGGSWREHMLKEVDLGAHAARVHFTGKLPYARYLSLLQISSTHLYLTYPFVLSWSCIEAMAAGCLIVASDTAPVQEVIQHEWNGLLVPFHEPAAIAASVIDALAGRRDAARLREEARNTVLERFALRECLADQIMLVRRLTG